MRRSLVVAYFVLCILLFSTVECFAYIDPSTTTYLIQIVAGGIIAVGTGIGIYWHKVKKAVTGKREEKKPEPVNNIQREGKTFSAEEILAMSENDSEEK